jgi:uncharacterized protein YkwD
MSRLLAPAVLAAVLGVASLTAVPAEAASCRGANATLAKGNTGKVRDATLCLLNLERAKAGRPKLRDDRRLRIAATRHSRDMVRHRYFDHVAPDGDTVRTRAQRVHYLKASASSWFLAENIAWGLGRLATPKAIVRGWMHSPPHRANILSRQARDAGLGVVRGTPDGHRRGATYTLDFGRIR